MTVELGVDGVGSVTVPTLCPSTVKVTVPDGVEMNWISAEQSNSSVIVGDIAIIKMFRRVTDGPHPEAEMGRYLTENGFANTPALLGEVLRVHKDRISRGEVRLRKEVITEQQSVQVPVTREELVVERIAGDDVTPVQGSIGADKEIRIPLSEERASLGKQTVVREQVAVGKRAVEEVRNLDSDVQHEELRVEDETQKP